MMNKEIYVLTGYNGFIGQTRKPWVSIDTRLFVGELERLGYQVHLHEFHEVVNGRVTIHNSVVFYSFSQRENLRHYIRDCLMYLQACGNTLVPNFEMFCCYANKGWQELLRNKLKFGNLSSIYFSSKRELEAYDLNFPLVFKPLGGSNSSGVAMVYTKEDVLKQLRKLEPETNPLLALDLWRRRNLRKNKKFPGYPDYDMRKDANLYQDYIIPEVPFMLQEFVPHLKCDYRVVAIGGHYFISKRLVRKGDFRASGSKHFDFDLKNPQPLLQFTADICAKLNVPCLSVDLGVDADSGIHLFEYQAQHFGIFTIISSPGYWHSVDGTWKFQPGHEVYEIELARGLNSFLIR